MAANIIIWLVVSTILKHMNVGRILPFLLWKNKNIVQTNWLCMDIYGDNPLVIYGLSP